MPQHCTDCLSQPRGLEGHEGLYLFHESRARSPGHLFMCARCQLLWSRNYAGGGVFEWRELPGIDEAGG